MAHHMCMARRWVTIVETVTFEHASKASMTADEVEAAKQMIAQEPECGAVMAGTGGVRKVRFAVGSKGKSGGVRIIYYFYNETFPVFLLTVFAKADRANLSKAERNQLAGLVSTLVQTYQKKRRQQ